MRKCSVRNFLLAVMVAVPAIIVSPVTVHASDMEQIILDIKSGKMTPEEAGISQEDWAIIQEGYDNGTLKVTDVGTGEVEYKGENHDAHAAAWAKEHGDADTSSEDNGATSGVSSENVSEPAATAGSSVSDEADANNTGTVATDESVTTTPEGQEQANVTTETEETEDAAPIERNTVDYNNGFNPVILIVVMAVILVVAVTLVVVVLLLPAKRKTENTETVSKEESQDEEE